MGIITNAGLAYISSQQANNQPVQMSHFVVAYIPDLDVMSTPDPDDGLPDQTLITGQFPIAREGYNNQDSITYTLELDSSVGNFDFNWYAIITDSNEVAAINFIYPVFKRSGIQQIVTRNFVMNYARAQNATGITIPAQTWQFDYTAQMTNVEDSIAAVNTDLQQTKENINNRLLEHSNQLIDHTQQLQNHAQQLQSHAQLHNNHGQRLDGHDTTLGQHNDAININSTNINGHTALIEEHTREINGQANLLTNHESRIQQNSDGLVAVNNRIGEIQSVMSIPVSSRSSSALIRLPTQNQPSAFRLSISVFSSSPQYEFTGVFDILVSINGERRIKPIVTGGNKRLGMTLYLNDDATGYITCALDDNNVVNTNAHVVLTPYAGSSFLYTGARQSTKYGFDLVFDRTGEVDF